MTKEELSKYFYIKKEMEQIERKIKEVDESYLCSYRYNGMRYERQLSNPEEMRMIKIEKYNLLLEDKKEEALNELIKIENFLSSIEDPSTRVIFNYRYIEFKGWRQIAKLVHMSERTVFYKHNNELKK